MKRLIKKTVAVLVAFAIVMGMLCNLKIDSYAEINHIDCDVSKKAFTVYVRPYNGIAIKDAFPINYGATQTDITFHSKNTKITDKASGNEVGGNEKIVTGKTYHYYTYIETSENQGMHHEAIDISQYTISPKNATFASDSGVFSNITTSAGTDKTSRVIEFDVTVKDQPNYNLGTLTVDFTKDNVSMNSSDSRYDSVMGYLFGEKDKNNIGYHWSDNNSYLDFDLDKDGKYDLRYISDGDYVTKLGTCSLTKPISFLKTQQEIENYEFHYETYYSKIIFDFTQNSSNNNNNNNNSSDNSSNSGSGKSPKGSSYKNEWVKDQWYDANGKASYKYKGSWKSNSKGWWFEDENGWYPHSQWQKIDGKWYYFTADGYMDYSEYRDGCWLGADGAWDENYSHGKWHLDGTGWWYEDNGWYPHNQYLWIDGVKYWFNSSGYMS